MVVFLSATALGAQASEWVWGGKLDLTRGVANVEGAGGGGLSTWALITGNETRDGVGGEASATAVQLPDFTFRAVGAGVGLYDRIEFSYAHQAFDTRNAGATLGIGKDFTFHQEVLGAKVRLFGDAVYDQDRWAPQVSLGAQAKWNDQDAIVHAVGARSDQGIDYYVAATKILLDKSLVLNATLRMTKANQTGLLGFGGDRSNAYHAEFEGSAGYLLTRKLLIGAEYRTKPDNLGFAHESNWADVFAAYALNKSISAVLAYADLGDIATFKRQRGLYVSLQAGF